MPFFFFTLYEIMKAIWVSLNSSKNTGIDILKTPKKSRKLLGEKQITGLACAPVLNHF